MAYRPASSPQNLLTVQAAAEILAVSPLTVRDWVFDRRLASIKVGRCIRIEQVEVQRMIESGRRDRRAS